LKCAGTSIIYNRISPNFSRVVETNVRNNGTVISSRNLRYLCSLVCQTLVTNESTAAKNKVVLSLNRINRLVCPTYRSFVTRVSQLKIWNF
jgi:hypothetical protein